ncbi:hypothetical protein NQZ68_015163 [Dissostichus eleginoides]|nr:hypothetical protein NQZ68_015163 [Dissostichus eleginoides]
MPVYCAEYALMWSSLAVRLPAKPCHRNSVNPFLCHQDSAGSWLLGLELFLSLHILLRVSSWVCLLVVLRETVIRDFRKQLQLQSKVTVAVTLNHNRATIDV